MNTNELVLAVGISGIGKSSYIHYNAPDSLFTVISTDKLRAILGKNESDQDVNHKVFPTAIIMAEYALKHGNRHVVIDATNITRAARKPFIEAARRQNCRVAVWLFPLDFDLAKKQNRKRERQVPLNVIANQFAIYEEPTLEEVDVIDPVKYYD